MDTRRTGCLIRLRTIRPLLLLAVLWPTSAAAAPAGVEDVLPDVRVPLARVCNEMTEMRGAVLRIRLRDERKRPVYRVEVADRTSEAEVRVDAVTGNILGEKRSSLSRSTARLLAVLERGDKSACDFIHQALREARTGVAYEVRLRLTDGDLLGEVRMMDGGEKLRISMLETRGRPQPTRVSRMRADEEDDDDAFERYDEVVAEPEPEPAPQPGGATRIRRGEQPAPAPAEPRQPTRVRRDATDGRELAPQPPPSAPRSIGPILAGTKWNFDRDEAGKPPLSWQFTAAGHAWRIERDRSAPSAPHVFAHVGRRGAPGPVAALSTTTTFRDFVASVAIRAAGGEGSGGGLIWRARDDRNFYACTLDPARGAITVLRVEDGYASPLATTRIRISDDGWNTLHVQMVGDEIVCYLNGREALSLRDGALSGAGMLGLWATADAVTHFDDLAVRLP